MDQKNEFWRMVRESIMHEDALINHRFSRMLAVQAAVFGAFFLAERSAFAGELSPFIFGIVQTLMVLITLTSALFCWTVNANIRDAVEQVSRLKLWWRATYPRERPPKSLSEDECAEQLPGETASDAEGVIKEMRPKLEQLRNLLAKEPGLDDGKDDRETANAEQHGDEPSVSRRRRYIEPPQGRVRLGRYNQVATPYPPIAGEFQNSWRTDSRNLPLLLCGVNFALAIGCVASLFVGSVRQEPASKPDSRFAEFVRDHAHYAFDSQAFTDRLSEAMREEVGKQTKSVEQLRSLHTRWLPDEN